MLTFHKTQCCGVNEIGTLRYYINNPKAAMMDFCDQNLSKPGQVKYGTYEARPDTLYTFYYFTAGVYDLLHRMETCYGHQFAQFILDNKLGEIITLPPKVNAGWHPSHHAQVWLWSPDTAAIRAWYQTNKPRI